MSKDRITPPYGSFSSVKSFIGSLKKTVFPDAIERSMMKGMSGQTQTEVLSALRFLGGLNSEGHTADPLRQLVDAHGTDSWQKVLLGIVESKYKPILKGVDVKSGGGKQLQSAFRNATSSDGHMLRRQILFYLAALKDAGIQYSPHFKDATKGLTARKKTSPKKPKANSEVEHDDENETPPPAKGMIDLPIPVGEGQFIRISKDITTEQFAMVKAVVSVVEQMAKQNSGAETE